MYDIEVLCICRVRYRWWYRLKKVLLQVGLPESGNLEEETGGTTFQTETKQVHGGKQIVKETQKNWAGRK